MINTALTCLCLATLQPPTTPPAPAAEIQSLGARLHAVKTTANVQQGADEGALFAQIEACEAAGSASEEVLRLLACDNSTVAARAAYAMGTLRCQKAVVTLCSMVHGHADATVRRHAMAALHKIQDPRSTPTSLTALSAPDPQVRALAAAILGSLRADGAAPKLLEVLAIDDAPADSPDRVAAYVALADLGDPSALVAAAASGGTGAKEQQAMAYLFQTLSPKLSPTKETATLVAVLDHHNHLLRRYAIQRLGVLQQPSAAKALEDRLAEETSLRQLVEVSLTAIRNADTHRAAGEAVKDASNQAASLSVAASKWWASLGTGGHWMVAIALGSFTLLMVCWRRARRERRWRTASDAMVAMVGHSEGFEGDYYAEDGRAFDPSGEGEFTAEQGEVFDGWGDAQTDYEAEPTEGDYPETR